MVKFRDDSGPASDDEDAVDRDSSEDSESDSDGDEARASQAPLPGLVDNAPLSLEDDAEPALIYQAAPELGEEDEGEGGYDEDNSTRHTLADSSKTPTTDLESDAEKAKKKKKKKKKCYYVCLTNCKYDSVKRVSKRFGFKDVSDDEDWNLYWTDYSVTLERVMDMKKYQKINHFPGMSSICRKDLLARNMNRMLKLFPKEYNVFPRSWCLPADYGDFQAFTRMKKHKTYILKPESGCQGKGIWVTKNPREIKAQEHQLCQQYISKPFLLDGYKFDLRIYVLVVSCDPLRIFVFKDGLARFATTKYIDPSHNNVSNVFMHLTNYAINKTSSDFIRDDEAGSKRRITTINKWMEQHGYDLDKMWRDIDDVIIKTMISTHSILKHNYRTCFPNHIRGSACFEILGFDVMMDKKLKPFLLEVNHSPSFHTDHKLDKEIKEALLFDTLNLVNFGAVDRRKCVEEEKRKIKERLFQRQNKKESKEEFDQAQLKWLDEAEKYENNHLGNFRRIYPIEGYEKYDKYFNSSGSLYQETAACKARSEAARLQREEITRKQEKLDAMLRKKKDLARPESPGTRRKRVTRRPNMPQRRLNAGRSEPYGGGPVAGYGDATSRTLEPVDSLQPVDILEDEELERISGLLQRDNLVRGLGIVEHVYRLLHCTPGTMGIQLKAEHKYNMNHSHNGLTKLKRLPGIDHSQDNRLNPSNRHGNQRVLGAKQQLWYQQNLESVDKLIYQARTDSSAYNIGDSPVNIRRVPPEQIVFEREKQRLQENKNTELSTTDTVQSQSGADDSGGRGGIQLTDGNHGNNFLSRNYHQSTVTYPGSRLIKVSSGSNMSLPQDRNMPISTHRTRYSNRKPVAQQQQGMMGTRGGNAATSAESAKGTPRVGAAPPQQYPAVPQTPPHAASLQGGSHVLPQYQYAFPTMVKVAAPQSGPGMGGVAQPLHVPAGLSIVSAPAPMAHRPDAVSAGSNGPRAVYSTTPGQPSLESLTQRVGKVGSGSRLRATGKVKDIEMRGNHTIVFS